MAAAAAAVVVLFVVGVVVFDAVAVRVARVGVCVGIAVDLAAVDAFVFAIVISVVAVADVCVDADVAGADVVVAGDGGVAHVDAQSICVHMCPLFYIDSVNRHV